MHLKVLTTSLRDVVRVGSQVSLMHNGSKVRIYDAKNLCQLCELESPEIQFHTDDERTEIELHGMIPHGDSANLYRSVTFTLG